MTKTLRLFFRLPDEAAVDDAADEAAGLDAAADVAAGADELDELDELEEQAARPTVAITGSASASFLARGYPESGSRITAWSTAPGHGCHLDPA